MATQTVAVERITWRDLWILLAGRLAFNTAFRIVYPLLTLLAAGFAVSLQTASTLVTLQVAAMLLSPLGGVLADRYGERAVLGLALGLLATGAAVCAVAPSFALFLGGYALIGLGTALFMPGVQAYASNRSVYGERGRVLGFLELSWALAALVGVAGLTLLIEARGSWSPAFLVIAMAALLTLGLTLTLGGAGRSPARVGPRGVPLWQGVVAAVRQRGVAAAIIFIVLQMFAVELIFVAYAGWLTAAFGASTQQLGLVFGLLGLIELAGSMGATLFTDRIGKRRAVLAGFAATGALLLLLPTSAGNWGLFLTLFLLFGLCFEFAIVSVFPLVSGLGRETRGATLALAVAASGVGRIVGSLAGPLLFERLGFGANGLVAGAAALVGVALGAILLREGRE